MSEPDNAEERQRWILSALADGEAASSEHEAAFRAWREDDDSRATWHAYQLIGDVLRSDDLANPPSQDTALLRAVRARLAQEPVVFAPAQDEVEAATEGRAAAAASTSRHADRRIGTWARAHWQGPAAMAAGFLIVAGGLMMRPAAVDPKVADSGPAPSQPTAAVPVAAADQLRPYLDAHREWGGTASIQMPDAGLRSVSLTQSAR